MRAPSANPDAATEPAAMAVQTAGVDISKEHLDVRIYPRGAPSALATMPTASRPSSPGWLCTCRPASSEATGAYYRAFARALGSRGLPVVKVNPRQARPFAESFGTRAKTHRVDAAMLARFGALLEPPMRPIASITLDRMRQLHAARSAPPTALLRAASQSDRCAVTEDRTAAQNRQKNLVLGRLKRQAAQAWPRSRIRSPPLTTSPTRQNRSRPPGALQQPYQHPRCRQRHRTRLADRMPELGTMEHRQAASLAAGLASVTTIASTRRRPSVIARPQSSPMQP